MKYVVLTYNLTSNKNNQYPYEDVCYMVKNISSINAGTKSCMIIKSLEQDILSLIKKIKDKYDFCLICDNQKHKSIFFEEFTDLNWKIKGKIKRNRYFLDGKFIPEQYDLSFLWVNLSQQIDFSMLEPSVVGDVAFPWFSKILFNGE